MKKILHTMRNHPLGPLVLAIIGGGIVGLGTDKVVLDEAIRLEASILAPEVTEYYAEADIGDIVLDDQDFVVTELAPTEGAVESVARSVRVVKVTEEEASPVVAESVTADVVVEEVVAISHDEDVRNALNALQDEYNAMLSGLQAEQKIVEDLQNAYMAAVASGGDTAEIRTQLESFAPDVMGTQPEQVMYVDEEPRG